MSSKKRKKTAADGQPSTTSQSIEEPDEHENCDLDLGKFETRKLCDIGHDPYGVRAVEALRRTRGLREDQPSTSSPADFEERLRNYRLKFPITRSAEEVKVDSRPTMSAAEVNELAENAGKIHAFVIGFDALEPAASQKLADTICRQLDRTAHELTVVMKQGRRDTPDAKFALIQHILRTNRLTVDQLHEFYRMKWRRRCDKLATEAAATPHRSRSTVVESSDEGETATTAPSSRKRKLREDCGDGSPMPSKNQID